MATLYVRLLNIDILSVSSNAQKFAYSSWKRFVYLFF